MASKQGYAAELSKYLDKRIDIRMNGKRHIAGIVKGFDAFMNLVMDNAIEILAKNEKRELGTIIIRGNSIELWECLDKIIQ